MESGDYRYDYKHGREGEILVLNTDNCSNGNLVTNFSHVKILDVIHKSIAKEPTEVVNKWAYFCRKKNSRKVVNCYHRGTSKISLEIDNRSQKT